MKSTIKLLIIGSNGQLGWELVGQGRDQGFTIAAVDLPEFDITDASELKKVVSKTDASLIINASAYTAVDKAESEPDAAFAVNRDGPAHLASLCHETGIPLIHISTDYVFDGTKKGPYRGLRQEQGRGRKSGKGYYSGTFDHQDSMALWHPWEQFRYDHAQARKRKGSGALTNTAAPRMQPISLRQSYR